MVLALLPLLFLYWLNAAIRLPVIQQPTDLFERDGFRHEEVDAAGESFALISAGSEAREGDDEGWGGGGFVAVVVAAGFFDVADGAGGFEAVHDRHANVCRVWKVVRSMDCGLWKGQGGIWGGLTHEDDIVAMLV